MSMKQVFSAGIAAAVLLSGVANAETVTLSDGDGYGYDHYWSDSIQASSQYYDDYGLYNNFLLLHFDSDNQEPMYTYGGYSLNVDGVEQHNFHFDNGESFGNYYVEGGYITSFSYQYVTLTGEQYNYSYIDSTYLSSYYDGGEGETLYSEEPFDFNPLLDAIWDPLLTGYGIFDFQKTAIHYADGSSVSMGAIIAGGNGNLQVHAYGDFEATWYSGSPISFITVAYGIPAVPEPETWAMLLAGLGLVGGIARRRRGLRA
jgi:hypothetical protein